ncbi:MAG: RMD1 family protein, partial [Ketobacteraceae bacterium]|nr:RMD1 family protein [Ketobacteraceae bacterium]
MDLLGRDLDKSKVEPVLIHQLGAVRYRDAFLFRRPRGEVWFFEYGVMVSWDLPEDDRLQLCHQLKAVLNDASGQQFYEQYHYQVKPEQTFRIHHDVLTLTDEEPLVRLALSHGFAQSIKLEFFEDKARQVIQENRYLSKTLAATGKIPLNRRDLARLRG